MFYMTSDRLIDYNHYTWQILEEEEKLNHGEEKVSCQATAQEADGQA
jgi:hypothetical protein